jgi:hypothetical protein
VVANISRVERERNILTKEIKFHQYVVVTLVDCTSNFTIKIKIYLNSRELQKKEILIGKIVLITDLELSTIKSDTLYNETLLFARNNFYSEIFDEYDIERFDDEKLIQIAIELDEWRFQNRKLFEDFLNHESKIAVPNSHIQSFENYREVFKTGNLIFFDQIFEIIEELYYCESTEIFVQATISDIIINEEVKIIIENLNETKTIETNYPNWGIYSVEKDLGFLFRKNFSNNDFSSVIKKSYILRIHLFRKNYNDVEINLISLFTE